MQPIALINSGMVTAVGLTAPSSCAAIRAGLTNPTQSRYLDSGGEWVTAAAVPLDTPKRDRARLAKIAALAIEECLGVIPALEWKRIPVLLCLAEETRPGRTRALEEQLFPEIQDLLGESFAADSCTISHGRVSVAVALRHASVLIHPEKAPLVLIAAVDSLLNGPTLRHFDERRRLLTRRNSNGFIPGEAAAALLVGAPAKTAQLVVEGLGFASESATIESEEPRRAQGLTDAIRAALADAKCELHDLNFRITDLSGEHYYFKEAALALLRTLRKRKPEFDLWHPAECIGETGSAVGLVMLGLADTACRKGYAAGNRILHHLANDGGQRAAIITRFGT